MLPNVLIGLPAGKTSKEQPPDPLEPSNLLPGERWATLYACSRREEQFDRLCDHLGIRHYLPPYERHTGAHRRCTSHLRLFTGYLFACLDHETRLEILRTRGIVKTLWPDRESVTLRELRQIRSALEASVDLVVGPAVSRGDLGVVIVGGSLSVKGRQSTWFGMESAAGVGAGDE